MKLTFVKYSPEDQVLSGWLVKPSGDWRKDCETGKGYAVDLIQYLKTSGNLPFFSRVVKDSTNDPSGVSAGLLAHIGAVLSNSV